MAQIAYILLCHKDVDAIAVQARRLTAEGDVVAIHFDRNAAASDDAKLRASLKDDPNIVFVRRRIRCGWGQWSLVEATIEALKTATEAFPRASHFYLLSGDCMPIKSCEYTREFLDQHDKDFIESFDFFASNWIKTGFREERLIYRHWFNERSQAKLFYASYHLQSKLGLTRKPPKDVRVMIGSQWWCLRRQTVEAILEFIKQRPDVTRFFGTTWIPDETFFQTLVRHLIPNKDIENRTLTFLLFSDYGMPVTFYNDHYDLLLNQDYLFARKVSSEATRLKDRLGKLYSEKGKDFPISNEGARLFEFLTKKGRIGERYAPRFWEKEATIGREHSLLIVTCKKWHVAKRLIDRIKGTGNQIALEYLFDEQAASLPNLGGIEENLAKRTRHRRVLMRMLFDYYQTDRLLICLDPANLDVLRDFFSDRCHVKLLEIECQYSDSYLIGHAKRVGLMGELASGDTVQRLLPTIRNDVAKEIELIRDQNFSNHFKISERNSPEENARPLADFLGIARDKAGAIMATDYLFKDG